MSPQNGPSTGYGKYFHILHVLHLYFQLLLQGFNYFNCFCKTYAVESKPVPSSSPAARASVLNRSVLSPQSLYCPRQRQSPVRAVSDSTAAATWRHLVPITFISLFKQFVNFPERKKCELFIFVDAHVHAHYHEHDGVQGKGNLCTLFCLSLLASDMASCIAPVMR